jgi:predicted RNase H-like nuclease (RuvC/YqgF family)
MTQKQTIQKQAKQIKNLTKLNNDLEADLTDMEIELHELKYKYDEDYRKQYDERIDDLPF